MIDVDLRGARPAAWLQEGSSDERHKYTRAQGIWDINLCIFCTHVL